MNSLEVELITNDIILTLQKFEGVKGKITAQYLYKSLEVNFTFYLPNLSTTISVSIPNELYNTYNVYTLSDIVYRNLVNTVIKEVIKGD